MIKNKYLRVFAPALLLVFAMCSRDIVPDAPNEAAYPPPPAAVVSNLNIPINIDLFELAKTLNGSVPNELYSDLKGTDVGYGSKIALRIVRNGNIHCSYKNNQLQTSVPIKIVDGLVTTPLLKKDFDATMYIKLNTVLNVDNAWNFTAKTSPDFQWGQEPKLKVAGIEIPLGKMTTNAVTTQLKNVAPVIDKQIQETVSLRSTMLGVWNGLNEPRLMVESPAPVYLTIKPTAFSMSQIESKNDKNMNFNIGINTFISTHVGAKPERQNLGNLPNLQIKPIQNNLFRLSIPTAVRYEDVRKTVQQQVLGRKYPVKDNISIQINGFDFMGRGDKIAMMIDFIAHGKKAKGKFYLVGKPMLDVATQTLYFDDLDFDIKSKNVLLGSANFLLHKPLLEKIKEQSRYPLTEQLTSAKAMIQQTLNHYPVSNNVFLKGKINHLALDNIYLGKDFMSVFINADGNLEGHFKN